MTEFPLLDGSTVDFADVIDSHPKVDASKKIVLHEPFAREQLPWWLSYVTDNGPASPTFNGLSSGDTTDVVLSTGTTSVDDVTALAGPTLNWDNWSAVRFYAYDTVLGSPGSSVGMVLYSDNKDGASMSNGVRMQFHKISGEALRVFTYNAGSEGFNISHAMDLDVRQDFGFRMYEHGNDGHTFTPVAESQSYDNYGESQSNFPPAQDLTPYIGVRTEDTAADRTLTIGGVYLELVP